MINIKKVGIIGAMEEEIEQLKSDITLRSKAETAGLSFFEGVLLDKEVVVVTCGIGKVNAAICTQLMIERYDVDCIINVGIAGGLSKDVYPGDVVIASNLVQHDMDTTFFGDELGQIPRINRLDFPCDESLVDVARKVTKNYNQINSFVGRIISGDQFVHEKAKADQLRETFDACACEMEGAAIGQVCYLNQVPFLVIRSISDNSINGSAMDYEAFSIIAIKNSLAIIKDMLKII